MTRDQLVELAFEARESAYAPYSGFMVGAALLCSSGKVFLGCNIENASYGAAICAERTAAVKAVSAGDSTFEAVAIVGFARSCASGEQGFAYPCGICRQFLREFAAPDMKVYVARSREDVLETTLKELLPHSFGPEHLLV